MKTNKKGISLIVLVITIIVLAILAATVVNIIVNTGIINQATNAVKQFDESVKNEADELKFENFYISAMISGVKDGAYEIKKTENGRFTAAGVELDIDENVRLGWVYVKGGKIIKYEFYYDDYYVLKVNDEYREKELDISTLINVATYGAIPGDGLDDTEAIRNAVTYLNNNGGTLYFPTGTYDVSVSEKASPDRWNKEKLINAESDKDVNIDFFGSTIKLAGHKYPYAFLVAVTNCSNAEVRNGFLIGDRITHDYTAEETGADSMNHFGGYGIIVTNTDMASVYNMDVSQMTGDGIVTIYEQAEPAGTTFINQCNISYCRRLGIQIAAGNLIKVHNTEIHHIGDFGGINGIAPKSGIDLETFKTSRINTVEINNCKINRISNEYNTSAAGAGIIKADNVVVNTLKIQNSDIDNLQVDNGEIYNTRLNYNGITLLRSLEYMKIDNSQINLKEYRNGKIELEECEITNSKIEGTSCVSPADIGNAVVLSNVVIDNTEFYNLWGRPSNGNNYSNNSSYTYYGVAMVKGDKLTNCTFENCSMRIASIVPTLDGSRSTIKGCYLSFDGTVLDSNSSITLKNIDFIECNTRNINNPGWTVNFINCSGDYRTYFGTTKKVVQ